MRPPAFSTPEHFLHHNSRPRRENMPELAEHDIKRTIRIRQRLGVALDEIDFDAGNAGVFTRAFDECRRQIETRHLGAAACGGHRYDTGSAGDVQHTLSFVDRREFHELRGGRGGDDFDRHK